jgi:23S rRNA pseudouridine1911/1915/1917 synthase
VNSGFDYVERLGWKAEGRALLDYLAHRYAHSSRDEWAGRIAAGRVLVDGAPASGPEVLLRRGQSLVWRRPPWREPGVPLCFAILHRDPHLLAVAKPRGLPTVPGGGLLEHTLMALVRKVAPEASPLHRLDRGVSGVVLFARTDLARRALAASWRRGEVSRIYVALARGRPEWESLSVHLPIGPVPHPAGGTIHAVTPGGRASRTDLRVLTRGAGGDTLLEISLVTGRPHQIRIHLAAAGHPLVGEPLYGPGGTPPAGARVRPGEPGDPEFLLHARRVEFAHPASGRPIAIDCSPPLSLRAPAEGPVPRGLEAPEVQSSLP